MKNCGLIFLLLLLLFDYKDCLGQKPVYLSDSDGGYKALEELQYYYCKTLDNKTIYCHNNEEQDVALFKKVWEAHWHSPVPDSELQRVRKISTRYELSGEYGIMKEWYDDVDSAAKNLGLFIPVNNTPRIGTLPIRGVNASTEVDDLRKKYIIIVFNKSYSTFVYGISKTVVNSFDLKIENHHINFAYGKKAFDIYLAANPKMTTDFNKVIYSTMNSTMPPAIPLDKDKMFLIDRFTNSMELFAMAHEYAHVYLGHVHVGKSLKLENGQPIPIKNSPEVNISNKQSWQEEMAADLVAYKIINELYRMKSTPTFSPTYILAGPALYFTADLILNDASALSKKSTNPALSKEEESVFATIVKCFSSDNAKIEDCIKGINLVNYPSDHPHSLLRLKIAQALNILPKTNNDSAFFFSSFCESMIENLNLMWNRSKSKFVADSKAFKMEN